MARKDPLVALSPRVQQWIRKVKWPGLRPIQTKVIPDLLDNLRARREGDFVISAPTASGKTEAVFFPIATVLDESEPQDGADVLYICPLVALINQQAGRLNDGVIDRKRYAVTPWHKSAPASGKHHFESKPSGVLVITPESLESMFINRSAQLPAFFEKLRCIVIDEFHAFFNSPRGVQLVSQLNRIDRIANRKVPRLALSATFNRATEGLVKEHLRPGSGDSVTFLSDEHLQHELEFALHAYSELGDPADALRIDRRREDIAGQAYLDFRNLHASDAGREKAKGLIFVNSRKEAEFFSHRLNELAKDDGHDVKFFPHHGSLSPDERKEAETAIRDRHLPAVIVCTSTLELGIDIGMITQVGQVDPGNSVSSLHQRLGRSGRRHGQVGKLIMYVRDADENKRRSPLAKLHLPVFQALAQISLVQAKAYEPPDHRAAHLSTLIQQILSFAAQLGGRVSIAAVRDTLVETGPFYALRRDADPDDHLALLFARLEQYELLERETESEYGLTYNARKLMDNYRFYAAFQGGDDYRVQSTENGQQLGTVPSANLYAVGDRIIYARRTWTIVRISREMKVIFVAPAPDGQAPIFSGDPIPPSQAVVSRMEDLYKGTVAPDDVRVTETAEKLFKEGLDEYDRLELRTKSVIEYGKGVLLLPWIEYRGQLSLVRTLRYWGANASTMGVAVFAEGMGTESVKALLGDIASGKKAPPDAAEAMRAATSLIVDKHDRLLSPYLQRWNAATFRLDMDKVPKIAHRLLQVTATRSSGTPRPHRRRR